MLPVLLWLRWGGGWFRSRLGLLAIIRKIDWLQNAQLTEQGTRLKDYALQVCAALRTSTDTPPPSSK